MKIERSIMTITLDQEETAFLRGAKEILDKMYDEVKSDKVCDFIVIDCNDERSDVITDIMLKDALNFLEDAI